jgi:hypothetical protein
VSFVQALSVVCGRLQATTEMPTSTMTLVPTSFVAEKNEIRFRISSEHIANSVRQDMSAQAEAEHRLLRALTPMFHVLKTTCS